MLRWKVARVALFGVLAIFYVVAATEHAERVNTFKARGDQSGYLGDAQNVYANWHGVEPQVLIGERNRMPLYAGFLAAFWSPSMSNDEFFSRAKVWNIYLSLALLAVLAMVFSYSLPALPATNLTLIVAFCYFIFKAGYTQSELLFYFLCFLAFFASWRILTKNLTTKTGIAYGCAAGALAALAQLTKASMLPFVAIFVAVAIVDAVRRWPAMPPQSAARMVAVATAIAAFLAVLSPYLLTNKRVFGHYFYNVNTTFYIWYDDWPQASVGVIQHGDAVGWPAVPPDQLPSASRYWREHTVNQIAARIGGGVWDMIDRSYKTYWYFKYVLLFAAAGLTTALTRREQTRQAIAAHPGAFLFLMLYAAVYLVGIAFYAPVSGTGTTRFLIAHLTPFFCVASLFLSREPFSRTEWSIGGVRVGVQHFHLLVLVSLLFDITFVIWPRLMTTYGGF